MNESDDMLSFGKSAIHEALANFNDSEFWFLASCRWADRTNAVLFRMRSIAWADMVYSASVRDFLCTQQACCAVYAARCALEVARWIEKPTMTGEQRIYNLLQMTRAKAQEARMLGG